jgi:hypothetical protein
LTRLGQGAQFSMKKNVANCAYVPWSAGGFVDTAGAGKTNCDRAISANTAGSRYKLATSAFAVPPAGLEPAAYRLGDRDRPVHGVGSSPLSWL